MSEKVHEVPDTATPALLPCPFCGGEAVERRLFSPDGWWHQCSTCDVETPEYDSEVKAIAAWNRRTTPTAPTVDPAASIPGGVTAVADAAMPKWLRDAAKWVGPNLLRGIWHEAFADGWAAHQQALAVEVQELFEVQAGQRELKR